MTYYDDDFKYLNKKSYIYRCEDCGYQWDVSSKNNEEETETDEEEKIDKDNDIISSEELFNGPEVSECPVCGSNNFV